MQKNCLNVSISIISHHALRVMTFLNMYMQYSSESIQNINILY